MSRLSKFLLVIALCFVGFLGYRVYNISKTRAEREQSVEQMKSYLEELEAQATPKPEPTPTPTFDREKQEQILREEEERKRELERQAEERRAEAEANKLALTNKIRQTRMYFYSTLSDVDKVIYDKMYEAFATGTSATFSSSSGDYIPEETDIARVFRFLLCDHPEIYFINQVQTSYTTVGDVTVDLTLSGKYEYPEEQIKSMNQEILHKVKEITDSVPSGLDDYGKIKYVYEYIINNTKYNVNAPDNQTLYSALINHESVCSGYSKAAQFVLNQLGIECSTISGYVTQESLNGSNGGHMWNIVKCNRKLYYMDTTWGDSGVLIDGNPVEHVNYDYLLVPYEWISKTHMVGAEFDLPKCNSITDNYYVREGLYFETPNLEKFKDCVVEARKNTQKSVTFKFADERAYKEGYTYLITNDHLLDIVNAPPGKTVEYTAREDQYTIEVFLQNR